MDDQRPDPEALLKRIKAEERITSQTKGELKIFLGANAGVGKTYRMLAQAKVQKETGIDVVIGYVETHQRQETEALTQGLELIPRKKIEYGDLLLEEMDLDAVLARHPKLVLVDELAHTNAPGSRHYKRYQDVEELLSAGIDVFTTLNIQHVESLNDQVYQITGIRVKETVPDRILEMADELNGIELVDLSPQELLQRLKEGKVYVPQKAKQASEQFFKEGNLLALREMALRYTTQRVDKNVQWYMEQHAIEGPLTASSRILVCVGTTELSEKVIRLAKQLASTMDAEWYAVHVQSLLQAALSSKAQDRLTKNLKLAEELGGKVVTLTGQSLAQEILKFARRQNISFILIGWRARWNWRRLFQGALVNTLVRESGPIHVLVITDSNEKIKTDEKAEEKSRLAPDWKSLLKGGTLSFATAGICWAAKNWLKLPDVLMLFFLPVIASVGFWGWQAGFGAMILAILAFGFLFHPPPFSLILFLLAGLSCQYLTEQLRWKGESAKQSERFVLILYELSRKLLAIDTVSDLFKIAGDLLKQAFDCEVQFLFPDSIGRLQVNFQTSGVGALKESSSGVADWTFHYGKMAGKGTDTLSSSSLIYFPLKTKVATVGVLGVQIPKTQTTLGSDQMRLLESFANIVAVSAARILRVK
jgi:two-component system sensor histidine kinase KdpD